MENSKSRFIPPFKAHFLFKRNWINGQRTNDRDRDERIKSSTNPSNTLSYSLLTGAIGGGVASAILAFLYLLANSDDDLTKQLKDFLQKLRQQKQINAAAADLTNEIARKVIDLKNLLNTDEFKDIVLFGKEAQEKQENAYLVTLKRKQEEIDHLTTEIKALESQLQKYQRKEELLKSQHKLEKNEWEKQTIYHLDELQKKHADELKAIRTSHDEETSKFISEQKNLSFISHQLRQHLSLYDQCSKDSRNCFSDLNYYFLSKGELKFQSKAFSTNFMHVLRQALELNFNPFVTGLNFYGTSIPKDGFKEIFQGLKKNTSIKTLNLGYTNFGKEKELIQDFLEMLNHNHTLKEVNLYYSYLGDSDVDQLKATLKKHPSLRVLDLSSTKISREKKEELKKELGSDFTIKC